MNAVCKVVVVFSVLTLSVSSTFGQRCNGGVECILLNDCTGLYNQLQRNGNNPELTRLLRGLHCGFTGNQPMSTNTGLSSHKSSEQQRVQQANARKMPQKFIPHTTQLNIYDPAFWGLTTAKPKSKKRSTVKPKVRPTVNPTIRPIMQPITKPTFNSLTKPIVRPMIKPTVRPIMKPVAKPAVIPVVIPTVNSQTKFVEHLAMKPAVKPIMKPTVAEPAVHPVMKPIRNSHTKHVVHQPMKPAVNQKMKPTVKPIIKPIVAKPISNPLSKPAGHPTIKSSVKPLTKASARPLTNKPEVKPEPIMKPTVKPTMASALKPIINNPTVKPVVRLTVKPIMNAAVVKPKIQAPVNLKITANRKICCPPNFQGAQTDASSTDSSWSGNTSGGSSTGWNRGGVPLNTNSNKGNWNGGGGNANSNWDGANTNSNTGSTNDPTSLLPNMQTCGIQNNDRIVGGTRADIDEHPWLALIRYDKPVGWGFYCGGVLISSRYVLTAAHCVKGQDLPTNWRLSQVRLGEWNTSSSTDCVMDDCAPPVQDIPVEQTIPHEQYDPQDTNQHNDIALLRLARPVNFNGRNNDFVKPICLPLNRDMKNSGFDGNKMEVAGWGKTETRSESEVKLKVTVPVVSRRQCAAVFSRVGREIIDRQLCAGGEAGKDSCRGDSGGALMGRVTSAENWFALGVVSYGPSPCGTVGWPGVYTRVGAYVDWILSKLRP